MLAVFAALLLQSSVQSPPRDVRSPVSAGTAIVRGVVVDESTGAAIALALVSIEKLFDGEDNARAANSFRVETATDASGAFEFTELPAGDVIISAGDGEMRARYLSTTLHPEGASSTGRRSLNLKLGEVRADLTIRLPRAVAIEGRVVNERGEPMADIEVNARSDDPIGGGSASATDDRGYFRIFGLRPGMYRVCATPRAGWPGTAADGDLRLRYDRTCAPSLVSTPAENSSPAVIEMSRSATFTIAGTITSSGGADVSRAFVSIRRVKPDGSIDFRTDVRGERFVARGLLPGEYEIAVGLYEEDAIGRRTTVEHGFESVRLEGSDVSGIAVTTARAASVSGRVVRHPRSGQRLPSSLKVRFLTAAGEGRLDFAPPPEAAVNADGGFRLNGIIGARTVTMAYLAPGWFIDTVRHGDEDITGLPHEFRVSDDRAIEIVLSDRSAVARLRAVDTEGRAVDNAMLIVFPADSRHWNVRLLRTSAVSRAGIGEFKGQRPGAYLALALTERDLARFWRDRLAVDALARLARPITLRESEDSVIDVPLRALEAIR
jgi:hypothetical protein